MYQDLAKQGRKIYSICVRDDARTEDTVSTFCSFLFHRAMDRGCVVCGDAFTHEMQIEPIVTTDAARIIDISGLKYVMSDASVACEQIETLLKAGERVLYKGYPCQIAELKEYLKTEYDTLYTLETMCHGAISHKVWEKYIQEIHGDKNIYKLSFYNKELLGESPGVYVQYKDGTTYCGARGNDLFFRIFRDKLAFDDKCENCAYATHSRIGDITLGFFEGIDGRINQLQERSQEALMVVNTPKGHTLFDWIKDVLIINRELDFESFKKNCYYAYHHAPKPYKGRERFLSLLERCTLAKAYDYTMKQRYDVGIVGVWWGSNYGSMMTYYALAKTIQSFGLSTVMIDKPASAPNDPVFFTHAREFGKKHFEAISEVYSFEEMGLLNNLCDSFVVGSDQVWNYGVSRWWNRLFYLQFADADKKKISYAASFGHDEYNALKEEVIVERELFARFDAISVREQSGVDILRDVFSIEGTQVLDPVFLAEQRIYDALAEESDRKVEEPFIATYILDPTPEKIEAILHVAKCKNLRLVNMLDGEMKLFEANKEKSGLSVEENLHVEDWIYYIRHCAYLITDSCHGASFAVIYQKPFVCIGNADRGLTRFQSLFRLLELEQRFVLDAREIIERADLLEDIDYPPVYRIIERERQRSLDWLHDALFGYKSDSSYVCYPYADSRVTGEKYPQLYKGKREKNVFYNWLLIFYRERVKPYLGNTVQQKMRKVLKR